MRKTLLREMGRRLRSQRGESLTEVLVSTLIAAVALVMLASMISTGARLVDQSRDALRSYYNENNRLAAQDSEEDPAPETLTLEIVDEDNYNILLAPGEVTIRADQYTNDRITGLENDGPVTAYRYKSAEAGEP